MLKPRPTSSAFLLALIAACLTQNCSVYDSSLLISFDAGPDSKQTDTSADSSVDSTIDSAIDADSQQDALDSDSADTTDASPDARDPRYCDKCKDLALVRPPCPPLTQDSTSLTETFVLAARSVQMGADPDNKEDWQKIGFDQDCMATDSSGLPLSCKRPAGANLTEDGEAGRDNSFARNFGGQIGTLAKLGILATSPETDGNYRFDAGLNSILFTISDFNGTPNDPSVTFTFYMAAYTRDAITGEYLKAKWDGSDIWTIDADSVSPNGKPLYIDDSAYITDGKLVARLPNGLILKVQGSASTMTMQLNEPIVVGTLTADNKSFSEMILSGVWQTETALISLDSYAEEVGICSGSIQYMLAHQIVQTSSDIRLDLKPVPDKDCNAISLAMRFTTARGLLGPVREHKIPTHSTCGDAGTD